MVVSVGVLQFMAAQRVRNDLATEQQHQQQSNDNYVNRAVFLEIFPWSLKLTSQKLNINKKLL